MLLLIRSSLVSLHLGDVVTAARAGPLSALAWRSGREGSRAIGTTHRPPPLQQLLPPSPVMSMQSAVRRTSAVLAHLAASASASPRSASGGSPRAALSTVATAAASSSSTSGLGAGFAAPLDCLSSAPLATAAETAARDNARQLLPFNTGRVIDEPSGQVLQAVGHQAQRAAKAGAKVPALFSPLSVRSRAAGSTATLRLKNRVVVSPMCTYSSDDGFLNDFHLVHAGQFALGGAAMFIVEATAVSPEGRISPVDSGLWKAEHVGPLKRLVAFLASQDCRAGIQLAHAGRKASGMPVPLMPRVAASALKLNAGAELGGWPHDIKGPSALPFIPSMHHPHQMSLEEIATVVRQFAVASARATEAGFEYIEIHAAHGYLLSSFLSPTSNVRSDKYGGSLPNRARMLMEVVTAVREVYKGVLGVRLSCSEWIAEGGWTLSDTLELVSLLEPLGVDIIDCSSGGLNAKQNISPLVPGYQVPFARAVKAAHPGLTVAAVGLITDPVHADGIVSGGDADLVMLAREFLREPHWVMNAARALGYEMSWAPQYARAALSSKPQSVP